MNYYDEIRNKIIDNEIYSKVKDHSKERNTVITYFEIGRLLKEAGGKYGDNIIDEYSKKLIVEVGKKYNRRTLFRMKQFYNVFSNEKVSTLWTQLSWSHLRLLFSLNNEQINYYINITVERNFAVRELENKIKSNEYERLPIETRKKLIHEEKLEVKDLVPNPVLIKNVNSIEIITEKVLHNLILEDIESFMKELGNSFCFIGSEYKIKIGDTYHKIDLLLFNIKCNAYVVVELKVTEFKVEYISQVQKYMNYIDKNIKEINNNQTIGIIICRKKNKFVIEYCSDDRISVREYELVWFDNKESDDIEYIKKAKLYNIFKYVHNLPNIEIEKINNDVERHISLEIDNYKMIKCDETKIGCLYVTDKDDGKILEIKVLAQK